MRTHIVNAWHVLSDVCILGLYWECVFGIALLTQPWLHLLSWLDSPALDRMARASQVWWGMFALIVVALAVMWRPRWFGLVAVIAFVSVRIYDLWHVDDPNWFAFGAQLIFVGLTIRGTFRRAVRYG